MALKSDCLLSVCDNCTLTLLDRTDELTMMLEIGISHIDPDGIPAPWPRLLDFENATLVSAHDLKNFLQAKVSIQSFNEDIIEKVCGASVRTI